MKHIDNSRLSKICFLSLTFPLEERTIYTCILFFLRKISPELTAANPSLFAEEDWPWTNIRAHLPLLYVWDAYHSMAWQVVPCQHPDPNWQTPGRWIGMCKLNHCTTGPAAVLWLLDMSPYGAWSCSKKKLW